MNSMKLIGTGKHRIRSTEYIGRLTPFIEFLILKEISMGLYSEMILIFHCIHRHILVLNIVHEPISDFEIQKSVNRRNSPFLKTRKIGMIGLRIQCFYVISFPVPSTNSLNSNS